jgi:glycosyltransferase involved in cell wall biosynthesis
VGGGITRHISDIVATTTGVEHELIVPPKSTSLGSGAAYDQSSLAWMAARGVRIRHVQMRRKVADPRNVWSVWQLRRTVRCAQPDVVHAHSSIAGALARLANLPRIVPVVYTPNGLTTDRLGRAIERLLGRFAARIVAVSESEGRRAREWHLADTRRIVVVPNGIDVSPPTGGPALRPLLNLATGTPLVGTMMRLVPQKAPEEFVQVAGAVARSKPDVHFLLIGMGPLQDLVDAEIANQGIADRFHQLSHLESASAVLDQLDVFVLPSRFEGGPYAPLEAIRSGTPVVLSDVVGNTDVVVHGVSGMLAPFGDSESMATAVVELLDRPDLRRSVVEAARTRLYENFDSRKMGAALEQIYSDVVAEGTRRRTRRLPRPSSSASTHSPESKAAR